MAEITADTKFVRELLVTDTRVYEIIARTPKTLKLRATKDGEERRSENRDGNPYPCVWVTQVSDPTGPTYTVRLRKDGTYRMGRGLRPLRAVEGTPERFTDYRF